ncbi:MAG: RNA polymerase sigma factor [Planctomycetota bacterium]
MGHPTPANSLPRLTWAALRLAQPSESAAERSPDSPQQHAATRMTQTDEELVAAYVRGERSALRELMERYHTDLLRFLYRLTGQREIAEDAFQDTFLQLHLSAGRFDTTRRFRPWLFTIAANKARDALRKHRRQPMLTLSKPVAGEGSAEVVDLLEIATSAPSSRMAAAEQQAAVDQVLASLSYPLREVLLLAYFQRLSYAQIAEELSIPLGTVKSRLHSAVAQFAKRWKAQAYTRPPTDGGPTEPHG